MAAVELHVEDRVGVITLGRPPVNALSAAFVAEIGAAVGRLEAEGAQAGVITGRPHFAAGADITEFKDAQDGSGAVALASELSGVVRAMERTPLPIIAAVHGYALGGGLELAMGADLIYLSEEAQVGQPEIKLGLIPGAGGTQRLSRLIGLGRARELVYTGRFVGAEEAHRIGLANKVVPAEDLDRVAREDAARLAAGPTAAIATAKQIMTAGWSEPLDDALAEESAAFADLLLSDDAREGVEAFLEKRDPGFA